ncbi:MAG TPA: hypothetical protein VFC19_51800 [Candidatus Limnocylindrales bacterium]|nr:hypothetical protein [Candidatus Limnocylindrales bacterium]
MTVSRPPQLRVGEDVLVDGSVYTITGLSAASVQLTDAAGVRSERALAELVRSNGFGVLGQSRAALAPRGLLDDLPADVLARAYWWERHILEMLTGRRPDATQGSRPGTMYDPATRTLRQRELAKRDELAQAGHPVALSTLQRLRGSYERQGLWGLVDGRVTRAHGAGTDPRVLQAIGRQSRSRPASLLGRWAGCAGGCSRSWPSSPGSICWR